MRSRIEGGIFTGLQRNPSYCESRRCVAARILKSASGRSRAIYLEVLGHLKRADFAFSTREKHRPNDGRWSFTLNLLVLSPHRDDAALSLGLAIDGWLLAGHRVTVLGIFTRSLNAPFSDADTVHPNDRLSYVSAMRRKEDAELLKLLPGLRMVDLNLKDAVLRLRCPAQDLYTLAPSLEDTAIAKIQKALSRLDAQQAIDAILLPLGLGGHVDHLAVRYAARDFATMRAAAFYEDLPDALRTDDHGGFDALKDIDSAIRAELLAAGEHRTAVIVHANSGAVERKLRTVSVYASQIDESTMQMVSGFAGRYSGERVWANSCWTECAGLNTPKK